MQALSIRELGIRAVQDWERVSCSARAALSAMMQLEDIADDNGCDTGPEIVSDFLASSRGWRGPVASEVKAELRRRLQMMYH